MRFSILLLTTALSIAAGLAQTPAKSGAPAPETIGVCTYYSRIHNGHITAGREKFDSQALTAAHRTLPMGTKLKVTNLANDKSVIVRVNDRGPFAKGKTLSVTRRAARELGFLKQGTAKVRIEQVP